MDFRDGAGDAGGLAQEAAFALVAFDEMNPRAGLFGESESPGPYRESLRPDPRSTQRFA